MTQLPRPDLGPGYWLDAGGQQVHLMESDTQPLAANHFAIRVDDIDAAVTDAFVQFAKAGGTPMPLARPNVWSSTGSTATSATRWTSDS